MTHPQLESRIATLEVAMRTVLRCMTKPDRTWTDMLELGDALRRLGDHAAPSSGSEGGEPSIMDLRGIAPDATGDESSEDFVRRIRADAEATPTPPDAAGLEVVLARWRWKGGVKWYFSAPPLYREDECEIEPLVLQSAALAEIAKAKLERDTAVIEREWAKRDHEAAKRANGGLLDRIQELDAEIERLKDTIAMQKGMLDHHRSQPSAPVVTEEAVEAATRCWIDTFEAEPLDTESVIRQEMRCALEAAAPHLAPRRSVTREEFEDSVATAVREWADLHMGDTPTAVIRSILAVGFRAAGITVEEGGE